MWTLDPAKLLEQRCGSKCSDDTNGLPQAQAQARVGREALIPHLLLCPRNLRRWDSGGRDSGGRDSGRREWNGVEAARWWLLTILIFLTASVVPAAAAPSAGVSWRARSTAWWCHPGAMGDGHRLAASPLLSTLRFFSLPARLRFMLFFLSSTLCGSEP
jgi:hypothetical protein